KGIYKPEFINRFDAVVVFHPLTPENLMDIAQLMLLNIVKNLKEKEIDFLITENLKEKIVTLSYKPEFGAREMRRVMQDTIENSIAKVLLSDKITKGDTIEINPENFEIIKIVNNNSNN
ncbi:MAG: ATPase AAA-2 domain protein, partial [Parcubacteria group bacterium GW2011_GWA2_33_14]